MHCINFFMNLNKLHIPYFVVKYDLDMFQKKWYKLQHTRWFSDLKGKRDSTLNNSDLFEFSTALMKSENDG